LPQSNAFWFSWALAEPQTELVTDASGFSPYAYASPGPRWRGGWGWTMIFTAGLAALLLGLWLARRKRASGGR